MLVRATDVHGDPLEADWHIALEEQRAGGGGSVRTADVPPRGRAEFQTSALSFYLLRARAEGHHEVVKLVDGGDTTGEIKVPMPILPSAVSGYRWPVPWPEIPGIALDLDVAQEGARPWLLMTNAERGALLNIWAKLWATTIGLVPAATFVDEVTEVQEDRIICRMAGGLLDAIGKEQHLDRVPSGLHKPPPGYARGPSVKTRDTYGNLQITTFVHHGGEPGTMRGPTMADIDIDEHRGAIGHLFDVAEHHLTGGKTSAVEIQQIMVAHQGIDPGWRPLIG